MNRPPLSDDSCPRRNERHVWVDRPGQGTLWLGLTLLLDMGDLAAGSGPQTIHATLEVASSATAGTTLISTANIASDTAEVELANNTARATTFIGHQVYLPVVWR